MPQPMHSKSKNAFEGHKAMPFPVSKKSDGKSHSTTGAASNTANNTLLKLRWLFRSEATNAFETTA